MTPNINQTIKWIRSLFLLVWSCQITRWIIPWHHPRIEVDKNDPLRVRECLLILNIRFTFTTKNRLSIYLFLLFHHYSIMHCFVVVALELYESNSTSWWIRWLYSTVYRYCIGELVWVRTNYSHIRTSNFLCQLPLPAGSCIMPNVCKIHTNSTLKCIDGGVIIHCSWR